MKHRAVNLKREAVVRLEQFWGQRFFHDRLSMIMLAAGLALNALIVLQLLWRAHPTDYLVPVHYSNLTGFSTLQPWYSYYQMAMFSCSVTILNTFLGIQAFSRSRITSFFLQTGAFVVGLFCLAITSAFLSFIQ